ncbi:UDP-N-acetylmuramoyl-L-alanyl-D-glutamate--2,6-diaminopimelate ligase [Candidatus Epulonipiscium fishelsonii]|uniref:UDP-N-acetylmuramoyl-L-alanyl-D-glutamate--2, 6-diaminopimelate ligase n=1 Tax=Candidatus Epulonipiscium fishelsonii TaxID=77094 RepID=A0ACC8XFQ9_9FIRM|nr:UDP-N-acetylmuramoyl-L-alanyl-D-glutamate--2,6-diaminopimelate ligase [Epulopiscium sp. SCG-B11WGA-EpuloA1]
MELQKLLSQVEYQLIEGTLHQKVSEIIYDSRVKTVDGLFIAIKGFQSDGHKYIDTAIENGATTIVVQDDVPPKNVTVIKVSNTREVMAVLANNFYNDPSQNLNLVGVTGTNGKTSITFLLAQILERYGQKVGVIGTIENRIGDETLSAERTTPEAADLQKLFSRMVNEGVDTTMMEVSSHALDLNRVDGCKFDIGIFTNLTQDHLDFHLTMDNYAKAKSKLFSICDVPIINNDADYADLMIGACKNPPITYGIDKEADYMAKDIAITSSEVTYKLTYDGKTIDIKVPIPGKFTVYNTMAVIVASIKLGVPMNLIVETLKNVKGVPGRVQTFNSPKGYSVIVDYAHTPDGLENVLQAINQFAKSRIITVFGCGGDRDNKKRPIMGEIAAKYSTDVIITSDNPRTEEPNSIIEQIEVGTKKVTDEYIKIVDRKKAIYAALSRATSGDVVLIAGKGHETYQHLNTGIIHFDDSEIVQEYIEEEQNAH